MFAGQGSTHRTGYIYESIIRTGARHLLSLLRERGALPYSTFYDGTEETSDRLATTPDVGEGVAEAAMDLAVAQLEQQGIVVSEDLDAKLADEEPDYLIKLTEKGRSWFAEEFELHFHDAE